MVNKNYVSFNGKVYMLDVDAIMKWCLASKDTPVKEYEITEGYDMDIESNVGSKVVRELRSPNTQDDTIRYDFIKMLIAPFLSDVDDFKEVENDFSIAMTFNTLVNMGFIKEISE